MESQGQHTTEAVLNALPTPIIIFTLEGIRFANRAATKLTGYSLEQLQQMKLDDMLDMTQTSKIVKTASNAAVPIELTVNMTEWDGENAHIATLTDMSALKQMKKLYANASIYQMLTQNLPDISVFFFDTDLRFQVVEGKGFEEMGLKRESFKGKRLRDIFPPEVYERDEPALLAALRGERTSQEVVYENGIFIVQTVPLRDEHGDILGGMVISQDVTTRKHTETEQREQENLRIALQKERELNQLKTDMMVRISHEFRTPLTIILTSAELIAHYGDRMTPERQTQHLQKLVDQVNHLGRILENIGLVIQGSIREGNVVTQRFDIVGICKNIASMHTKRVIFHMQEEHLFVRGNPEQLHSIIMHLVSNALVYSDASELVNFSIQGEGELVMIKVQDKGIGIPEDEQSRIFEPFFRGSNTGEQRGLGLGLPIVKDVLDIHQGRIEVESQLGQGTTFTIWLPRVN